MKQSKLESFVEALVNTFIGFTITVSIYPFVNWICGIQMTIGQASLSTIIFTIVSIVRGYVIRRFFNNMTSLKKSITEWFSMTWINIKITYVCFEIVFRCRIIHGDEYVKITWRDCVRTFNRDGWLNGFPSDRFLVRIFCDEVTSYIIDRHYSK